MAVDTLLLDAIPAPAVDAGRGCLHELTQSLTVRHLMTPACELVGIDGDAPAAAALARMQQRYDQLPVHGADGRTIIGLVTQQAAMDAGVDAAVRHILDPLPFSALIHTDATLPQAMAALVGKPAALVTGSDGRSVAGLLHYADFNKHAARVFFYLWLSALEIGLVRKLTRYFDRHRLSMNDWLAHLPEPRQVNILGRYEVSRRGRIDLTPLEGADLTDLLQICRNLDALRLELGFATRSAFDQATSHLIPLRNAAMHPVRSLLSSHDELPRLLERYSHLERFVLLLNASSHACD